jgi:hypothetical protein
MLWRQVLFLSDDALWDEALRQRQVSSPGQVNAPRHSSPLPAIEVLSTTVPMVTESSNCEILTAGGSSLATHVERTFAYCALSYCTPTICVQRWRRWLSEIKVNQIQNTSSGTVHSTELISTGKSIQGLDSKATSNKRNLAARLAVRDRSESCEAECTNN